MTTERFVFDFDAIEANGPYCPIEEPYWPQPPSKSGLLESITGPFLRSRDRVRRILVNGVIRNLALVGDRMTAQLLFAGYEQPRLRGAVITGERKGPDLDRLAELAGERQERTSPAGLAAFRAIIALTPYQRARAAHGCEHPCSQCADPRQRQPGPQPPRGYEYGEPWSVPGEVTVDLGLGGPPIKAHGMRIVPIREITTTEGEGS